MDINSEKIQQIVKQVLSEMNGAPAAAPSASGPIPKTARVAMLTKLEHYDIKEYPAAAAVAACLTVTVVRAEICRMLTLKTELTADFVQALNLLVIKLLRTAELL